MLNISVTSSVSCSEYFIQEGKWLSKVVPLISVFFDGVTDARREDTGPRHLRCPWPLSRVSFQLASLGAQEIEQEHISNCVFPHAVTHLPLRIPVQRFPCRWTFYLVLSDFSIRFYPSGNTSTKVARCVDSADPTKEVREAVTTLVFFGV